MLLQVNTIEIVLIEHEQGKKVKVIFSPKEKVKLN